MSVHGLDKRDIAAVAVKNKRNAADHPSALLGRAEITVEDVLASETLAWPVQRLDVSPISDGAAALVVAAEGVAERITDRPVWIQGVGWNLDTAYWTNRDLAFPEYVANAARMAYDMAGVVEPRKRSTSPSPTTCSTTRSSTTWRGSCSSTGGRRPRRSATASSTATATCRAAPAAACSAWATRSRPPGS